MSQINEVVLVFIALFLPTSAWCQAQDEVQPDPATNSSPQYAQQSQSSRNDPPPSSDSGIVLLPESPASQNNTQGKQTKRMFGVVPNFGAVDADAQLPPLSTREKYSLAAHDSILDYSSFTWAGILAAQALALNSDPELGSGIAGYGRYYWRTFTDSVSGTFFTASLISSSKLGQPQ